VAQRSARIRVGFDGRDGLRRCLIVGFYGFCFDDAEHAGGNIVVAAGAECALDQFVTGLLGIASGNDSDFIFYERAVPQPKSSVKSLSASQAPAK
jgi:hypothetical protein